MYKLKGDHSLSQKLNTSCGGCELEEKDLPLAATLFGWTVHSQLFGGEAGSTVIKSFAQSLAANLLAALPPPPQIMLGIFSQQGPTSFTCLTISYPWEWLRGIQDCIGLCGILVGPHQRDVGWEKVSSH